MGHRSVDAKHTTTHNNVMQVGAQIDASLPKDAPMEDVVTITHVRVARLLVHAQTYNSYH
jgi:hypothetical protein